MSDPKPAPLDAAVEALKSAPRPRSSSSSFDLVAYMDWFFKTRGAALALLQSGDYVLVPREATADVKEEHPATDWDAIAINGEQT